MHTDWEERSKAVFIHRQHDVVIENSKEYTHIQTARTNKWIHQGHRIQDQYTKISYISIN